MVHQGNAMPLEVVGVWVNDSGQYVIVNSTHSMQTKIGGQHFAAWGIGFAADGTFTGEWCASSNLQPAASANVGMAYGSTRTEASMPMPALSDTRGSAGKISVALGRRDAHGNLTTIDIRTTQSRGGTGLSGTFMPILNINSVQFSGHWKSAAADLTIIDQGGRTSELNGTLTYDGERFIVRGSRTEGRGVIRLYNHQTNSSVGLAAVEWAPSREGIRALMERRTSGADSLSFTVQFAGTSISSMPEISLHRQ